MTWWSGFSMDGSESLSMILKWFYFVSAFPVLFNMYTDKDSNLISDNSVIFGPESAGFGPRDYKIWVSYSYSMSPVHSFLKTMKFTALLVSAWAGLLLQDWEPWLLFHHSQAEVAGTLGVLFQILAMVVDVLVPLGVLLLSPLSKLYP